MRSRFLLACSLLLTAARAQQCYFPDGSVDADSAPCNTTSGGAISCCKKGDTCFTDGTCAESTTNIPYRASCTDKSWKSRACPSWCLDEAQNGIRNTSRRILDCSPNLSQSCCLDPKNNTCCDYGPFFDYVPGVIIAVLDSNGTNRLDRAATTTSTSGSALETSTNLTTGSNTSSAATANGTNPNNGTVIGLSVVLAVVVVACTALITFLVQRWKQERRLRVEAQSMLAAAEQTQTAYSVHTVQQSSADSPTKGAMMMQYPGYSQEMYMHVPSTRTAAEVGMGHDIVEMPGESGSRELPVRSGTVLHVVQPGTPPTTHVGTPPTTYVGAEGTPHVGTPATTYSVPVGVVWPVGADGEPGRI